MSDLVGNPEDRFSRVAAQMLKLDPGLVVLDMSSLKIYFIFDNKTK